MKMSLRTYELFICLSSKLPASEKLPLARGRSILHLFLSKQTEKLIVAKSKVDGGGMGVTVDVDSSVSGDHVGAGVSGCGGKVE